MDCKFYDQDEMMRYMHVLYSTNKKVQERLMEVDDLDIGKAIKIAKAYETNLEQLKLITIRGLSDYAIVLMEERTKDCTHVNAVKSRCQSYTTLHVGRENLPLNYKVDTGSEIKVLPITTFGKLAESLTKRLKPTRARLTGYGGHEVPTTGTCRIECNIRDKTHSREFFIADTTSTHIIGFDSCRIIG
ncbi:hypothetical protein LSAT2_021475, partial [Lamellibrachia satsuma]